MRRIGAMISGKLYEAKRQYPIIKEFVKGMCIVEKELNKDVCKKPPREKRRRF